MHTQPRNKLVMFTTTGVVIAGMTLATYLATGASTQDRTTADKIQAGEIASSGEIVDAVRAGEYAYEQLPLQANIESIVMADAEGLTLLHSGPSDLGFGRAETASFYNDTNTTITIAWQDVPNPETHDLGTYYDFALLPEDEDGSQRSADESTPDRPDIVIREADDKQYLYYDFDGWVRQVFVFDRAKGILAAADIVVAGAVGGEQRKTNDPYSAAPSNATLTTILENVLDSAPTG